MKTYVTNMQYYETKYNITINKYRNLPPPPSSVTPSISRSKHWAFFLSFSNTSAYPGNLKNRPNATRECGGIVGFPI
jgi:hypothetical protein